MASHLRQHVKAWDVERLCLLQACLKERYKTSAVLAAWAVLFRQTNAVWVCFIIAVSATSLMCLLPNCSACQLGFTLPIWFSCPLALCVCITLESA